MKRPPLLIVEREDAPYYLLLSLVAFSLTVVVVRLFLQITGYPQVGISTLHIAHMLWGGLLLFFSVLIILIWDDPIFLVMGAILSGVGIGLFIDEIGKFITQTNDYFFPAAAPIIYGFFLLTVFIYILVRRPEEEDPQKAMILSLERLQDAIYGELDERDLEELKSDLAFAKHSDRPEIKKMAVILTDFIEEGNVPFRDFEPGFLHRLGISLRDLGDRLGQNHHRRLVVIGLLITAVTALITFVGLIWASLSPGATAQSFVAGLAIEAQKNDIYSVTANLIRLVVEVAVGLVALLGIIFLVNKNDKRGIIFALGAVLLSLTAVQLITFYLDQFTAVIPTLFQFVFLFIILAYRSWYLVPKRPKSQNTV